MHKNHSVKSMSIFSFITCKLCIEPGAGFPAVPVTRPPECWDCPMDIRPVDSLAQRQHVWVARPTLKAFDQEQSLAAIHHCTFPGGSSRPSPSASHSALSIRVGISIT